MVALVDVVVVVVIFVVVVGVLIRMLGQHANPLRGAYQT